MWLATGVLATIRGETTTRYSNSGSSEERVIFHKRLGAVALWAETVSDGNQHSIQHDPLCPATRKSATCLEVTMILENIGTIASTQSLGRRGLSCSGRRGIPTILLCVVSELLLFRRYREAYQR